MPSLDTILVTVKRVVDYNTPIHVKSDFTGVDTQNVKMSMNPFDEIAVEEAVSLKEKGLCRIVKVVSIGNKACLDTIRTALAMGADEGIFIDMETGTETETGTGTGDAHMLTSLNLAKILQKIVEKETPDLTILGKQAIDSDNNQCGQMLAALTGRPQGTFASALTLKDDQTIDVTREVDGGLETLNLSLPAIITTDLRLNTPRFASLPNIMRAKKKPITTIALTDLGLAPLTRGYDVQKVEPPLPRQEGVKVPDVDTLIDKLRLEAKVLPSP
ncbi:MAG: electron transfer flavoprotein subunit beta/FixA family protein [Alphaproteobacteria bacterium GM7ARS4]|nr:electron transfer flavoprotein subunit beta/FixA family protein [Alphaproteobacteria bacterium GM7ARS4]